MSHYALVQLRVGEVSTGQFSKDRVGPNTTSLAYVTREPRDVMVSATRIDTDLTTIEHLDWEPELKCEHSQHDQSRGSHRGPAWVLVDIHCPHCSQAARFAFCERWWNHSGAHGVTCVVCREYVSRDDMYRVVRWLP